MMISDTKDKYCDYNKFRRIRYFHGMLLGDKDFTQEQQYHIEKRKLLNRMLHGWGVVCGLGIEYEPGKKWITITPGMALDCHGNEILVCEPFRIDLTPDLCPGGDNIKTGTDTDDPCKPNNNAEEPNTFYVCISYKETPTTLVPTTLPASNCKEKDCQHSRHQEGFCIKLLKQCPDPYPIMTDGLIKRFLDCEPENQKEQRYRNSPSENDRSEVEKCKNEALEEFCNQTPPCPDCCLEVHCVGLGKIQLTKDKRVEKVWINECRRYVISANLISYLISSTITGIDKIYEIENPDNEEAELLDANLIHRNPIGALCWLIKNRELVKDKIKIKEREVDFHKEVKDSADKCKSLENKLDQLIEIIKKSDNLKKLREEVNSIDYD